MSNGPSAEFKKRILEEVKKLCKQGEHTQAYDLFKVYYPDNEMYEYNLIYD